MSKIYTVSPSPHIHSGQSVNRLMYDVLIALLPAFCVSVYFFGLGAIYVTAASVAICVLAEYLIAKFLLKIEPTISDGSAVLTGVLLAFNVPSNLPLWILALGALFAIGVGKMTYGGLGQNLFNPAIVGRVFLLISFPAQMTTWPKPEVSRWNLETVFSSGNYSQAYLDGFTGATPLEMAHVAAIKAANATATEAASGASIVDAASGASSAETVAETVVNEMPSSLEMFLGNMGGSTGEIAAGALILGFIYLLLRRVISWHIPVSIIATMAAFTGIMWLVDSELYADPLFHILSGGLLLGAIFMATDYVTSPMTKPGMIIFGIGIGLITAVIRIFGVYPEGMSFAIFIMNAFVPLINRYFKPRQFGKEVRRA